MTAEKHALNKVWNSYPEVFGSEESHINTKMVKKIVADTFAIGPFYYYTLNIGDSSLSNCSTSILNIHGFSEAPQNLLQIINLIHPDDLQYVIAAEEAAILQILKMGAESALKLKVSYCFRMKVADGSYHLFHHQALQTVLDQNGHILQALNIHTRINHLTNVNLHNVTISGIDDRDDFIQINVNNQSQGLQFYDILTKRELEILSLIASGLSAVEISNKIFISVHTVKTHRRNILRKTHTNKSSELIKKCIEWGLI